MDGNLPFSGNPAAGQMESLFWQVRCGTLKGPFPDTGEDAPPSTPAGLAAWLSTRTTNGDFSVKPYAFPLGMAVVMRCLCFVSVNDPVSGELLSDMKKDNTGANLRGIVFLYRPESGSGDNWLAALDQWIDTAPDGLVSAAQISVDPETDPELLSARLPDWAGKGLRLILWRYNGAGLPGQLMWRAAKLGIWNHVSGKDVVAVSSGGSGQNGDGQAAWIANNPNIVHSFEDLRADGQIRRQAPEALLAYRNVAPLPDMPFAATVPDPLLLLPLLARMSAKDLCRHRFVPETRGIRVLGRRVAFHFLRPKDLPSGVMDEIVAMVAAGGSVDITHVRANLERAYLVGYATERGVIVGNSSLKRPRQVFVDRIKRITGLDFTRFVERGYTSVRPEYRAMGVGARLLEGLTARALDVKVFSIISEDNLATQKIALRNNTKKIAAYYSDKTGKTMGIWMPAHMIEDDWKIMS